MLEADLTAQCAMNMKIIYEIKTWAKNCVHLVNVYYKIIEIINCKTQWNKNSFCF